jgi:hypothetical protein
LRSRFRFNTAERDGGGIYNAGTTTLTQSQVLRNRAGERGGGVFNRGNLLLSLSLILGNTAPTGTNVFED